MTENVVSVDTSLRELDVKFTATPFKSLSNQVIYVPKTMMENVKFNTLHKMGTAISPLYISLHDLYDFELSKIEDWFKANKLTLNASKTKYILFKNKKLRCKYHLT